MMRARISRWGNSLAIRLPKAAVASLRVREGEPVDLVIEGDTLTIRPGRPRYTLEELVAAMRPEDEPEILDDVNAPPAGEELL
jgi:antitoxin MazE